MSAKKRPSPPSEIQGEALLEWERICDDLETSGNLDKADRAILVVYVGTWEIHQAAMRGVVAHGAVVKHPNGVAGPSPFYKVGMETGKCLARLLESLGLTPAARARMKPVEVTVEDEDF